MVQSFNVQFYCRQSKATRNGYAPLEIAVNVNGERKFINLPYKCLPSDFNRKKQPKELIDYQANMRKRVNEILADMVASGEPLTADTLKDYIKNGGYKSYTIENLFDEYYKILQKRIGSTITKSVYSKYELVRDLFYTIAKKNAECASISPSHVRTFKAICESRYMTSTTGGYLQKLKTVLLYAQDNGRLKINPFIGVKITKGNKDIEYLSEEELRRLENLHIENKSLRNVLDAFLFECYSGISYADLKRISPYDIQVDNGIYFVQGRRQKTDKPFTSVLLPNFLNLIKVKVKVMEDNGLNNNQLEYKWVTIDDFKGENGREEFEEIFCKGLIDRELGVDFRFKMLANQKTNAYLHEVERLFSFPKSLTTHLGRHTYATLLANKYKCRMEVVASALGDSLKITTKHYAKFLSETTISEIGSKFKNVI